ncbi:prolipoprotein diacylglyceryl transferase [Paenarthrobacter sp. Z7-10]|uniref:prolipoprotein diacylglyceryl transferase n=1 Tax=Paenarthrobacter sp. Z7-10 TaxID=2787635 RepID=UPI0022A964C9|nr:prolipoprotein diacylglyceryl transferase family protein [Paenarthrobacter sp. Z7-10]MCZ2404450.1 prolipoprotein diacylglyceryl transferase [Paenarthrobacter sp. Z7-10]
MPVDPAAPSAADRRRHVSFHDLDPQGLAATYWIDTDRWKGPDELSVRFSGLKADGVPGKPPEKFQWYEDVDAISAGTGRVAVTAQVSNISAGTWQVSAEPVCRTDAEHRLHASTLPGTTPLRSTVHTRFAPLVHGPGVHLLSWPLLVCLGAVLAVTLEAVFLSARGVEPTGPVWLSVLANAVGVFGARIWWLALNRQPVRNFLKAGACIQGFLAGALGTVVLGALVFGWPVGRILDASAVGIFFGMAVGRPGCFFTGCCYGRPTSSRWGLWSSDRRIGRRRHPVQLYEAALALLIGLGTLPLMLGTPPHVPGLVFIGSVMVYTVGRQLLFPLRMDTRTPRGRNATILGCALIFGADILAAVAF